MFTRPFGKIVLGSILYIIVAGCEFQKEWNFIPDLNEDKIVAHGAVSLDTLFVEVLKAQPFFKERASNVIDDVQVVCIKDNQVFCTLTKINDSLFVAPSGSIFDGQGEYQIRIECPSLGVVSSAKQVIPNAVSIDSIFLGSVNPSFPRVNLYISFTDPDIQPNYYAVSCIEYSNGHAEGSEKLFGVKVFNDNTFNGKSCLLNYQVDKDIDSVRVNLFSISSDLYRFIKSIDDFDQSHSDPFITRPAMVYSNIENGYGIFGAFSVSSKVLKLNN